MSVQYPGTLRSVASAEGDEELAVVVAARRACQRLSRSDCAGMTVRVLSSETRTRDAPERVSGEASYERVVVELTDGATRTGTAVSHVSRDEACRLASRQACGGSCPLEVRIDESPH